MSFIWTCCETCLRDNWLEIIGILLCVWIWSFGKRRAKDKDSGGISIYGRWSLKTWKYIKYPEDFAEKKRVSRLETGGTAKYTRGKQKKMCPRETEKKETRKPKANSWKPKRCVFEKGESGWLCWIFLRECRETFFGFSQKAGFDYWWPLCKWYQQKSYEWESH